MKARRLGLWLQLLFGGCLMLAAWVLLVWVSARPALKGLIDLTPQAVNSVDPATEDLLRELRAQRAEIEFHLFYPPSTGAPANDLQAQQFRIRDRLRELTRLLLVRYQYLGGESVTIATHDLYGDVARTREAAAAFDYKETESDLVVVAVRMPGKERRYRKLSLLLDLGRIELPNTGTPGMKAGSLPVLKGFVGEEQISSAIKSLLVEGTPVAYLLRDFSSLLSITGERGDSYSLFLTSLAKSGFEVREWKTTAQATVPDDAALVIVLEPTADFTTRTAEALFAYVQRGGRVYVNYAWSPVDGSNPDGGRFGELLGYSLSEQPVFHLIRDSRRTAGRGLDGDMAVSKLQMFVNPRHPTTRRIAEAGRPLEVAMARQLRERPGAPAAVRREPLLRTGDQGWLALPGPDGAPSYRAPQLQLQTFEVGMSFEVDVAADAVKPNAPKTGQVVVVAGVFCNNVGFQHFGDFALNICNWMAERRVLLDLKSPGYEAKYLQLQPQQLERIGWLLVWGAPGVFLVLGLGVFFVRRRQ